MIIAGTSEARPVWIDYLGASDAEAVVCLRRLIDRDFAPMERLPGLRAA